MNALDRKMFRDLWHIKEQALAIALVIGCGVATFVMALTAVSSLRLSKETYYDRYRFADVFANVKRAPQSLVPRIGDIPGVARVQTRVVRDVTLDVPGLTEPAIGRLISVPDSGRPLLNEVYLRRGRYLQPGRTDEALVSEGFALAHGFQPGDRVKALINGRQRNLTIVGISLSPEYIYQIGPGDLLPDDKRFGIFWMSQTALEAAFDMEGAFNDISIKLMPGASEPEVLRRLDRLIAAYGGLGAYGRKDHLSDTFVSNEIKQLQGMALIAPSIFLSVAAFLLNVVLTRIIRTQREQIAVLKAFGYTNLQVGLHYLKLTLGIALVGVGLGSGFGIWLGRNLTVLYARFYRFPVLKFHLEPDVMIWVTLIACGAAAVGTLGALSRAIRLPPAEAMRPEPPASYRPTLAERLGFAGWLSQPARMVLRHLERKPAQAAMSVLGIALAVSVWILGSFSADALDYIIEVQFNFAQREDATVTFVDPRPQEVIYAMRNLPGVIRCEPFRAVPVRLRHGHFSRRVALMGLVQNPTLHRLVNEQVRNVSLPSEGIVLGSKLAELLGVRLGESITVEVLEGRRLVRQVPVTALVSEFIGAGAYMELDAIHRLLQEGGSISGAYLTADPAQLKPLYDDLKHAPRVTSVTARKAAIRNFEDTLAENMLRMRFFNVLFAGIIAFGVVYNSARIALAERSRELASLRVLGFTRREISFILLGELAVLTLAALPIGCLIGYLFAAFSIRSLDTDLYRIPLVIAPSTFATAVLVVIVAATVSSLAVRRQLDHLDLVAVLKTRE